LDANIAGVLCYLAAWITGLIFLLVDKRPFVRFHAAQSIGLSVGLFVVMAGFWIFTFAATIVTAAIGFPIGFLTVLLFPLVMIGAFLCFVLCMFKAYKNEKFKFPVIGDIVEKMVEAG
jgi:uncharacterized membrane protein